MESEVSGDNNHAALGDNWEPRSLDLLAAEFEEHCKRMRAAASTVGPAALARATEVQFDGSAMANA